jgi:phenylalanyl-tRNA synthetase beta chain
MGGQASEVTGQTVNVLLESAAFSPNHTSRTSRRLQLISESSSRYERGVDDATCEEYSARAAAMIVALAGGELAEGVVDCYPAPRLLPSLEFRVARFQAFVGAAIAESEAAAILTRLGCEVLPGAAGTLAVRPPSYRPDLLREVDLYEEVLRVHGMDRVPPTLPGGRERIGSEGDAQRLERRLGLLLRAMGLSETMTYAFVPPSDATDVPMPFDEKEQAAELINPISAEMSVLRRSLLPSLLRSVAYNLNHGVPDIQLYEIGTVFFAAEGRKVPKERQLLSAVLVGSRHEPSWSRNAEPVDFYDAKGILEAIGGELNVAKLRFKRLEPEVSGWLTYGRAASVLAGSSRLGWVGEVHPRVRAAFGIEVPVIAFELEVSPLAKAALAMRDFVPIPLYPAVMRDLAVVVDSQVTAEQVSQVLTSAGGALLAEARLFDVFEDADRLGADKKSLAFALSYRSPDRTLTSEEVEALHLKVVAKVSSVLGGEIRA